MKTASLSIRISKAEALALRRKAREEKISQGRLVRKALRAYGVTPESEPTRSGYDVIKHLLGRNRGGSRDLSTNPKHLESYGQ